MSTPAPGIHPTALVDSRAELAPGVSIGPYTTVGPHVSIGEGTRVGAHCVLEGHTEIGRNNHIFQFASIGAAPQDKKYAGEPTRLRIGHGNTIREFVTINTGTVQDAGLTCLGDDNWIMAYVHIAHDCQVGNHTILANAVQLAGHVQLGDWVFLGGLTGVHQFVRIGAHAMTAFQTRLAQDLPPFVTAGGNPARALGINAEGLRRRDFSDERLRAIKQMHRLLYRSALSLAVASERIGQLRTEMPGAETDIVQMQDFLAQATRGVVR